MSYLPRCAACGTLTLSSCGGCDLPLCGPVCAVSHGLSAHRYEAERRRYTINVADRAKARRRQTAAR